ncbi:50S ribosomal protein L23 [Candidatus Woesebacteria bacterium]|jgi:large subunit ribosomal protein L23|nr:50S ribosomal protein L23 [Candidatus Woesebacteria bacterium]
MNPYIIKRPVITEKTVRLASTARAYTFAVDKGASKYQIAQAVSELYGVTVEEVRTATIQSQSRRTGKKRMKAHTAAVKKGIVTIKAGEKIDIFDTAFSEKAA